MDDYKITLIKDSGESKDITNYSGELSWRDSIDTLGMELNFDVARNTEDRYMKSYDIVEVGDKVILTNKEKEIFRGIIVDLGTQRYSKSVVSYDYAFYLNQSKTIIQFNKIRADEAIKQLCNKFNVPIGNITNIFIRITKIYKEDTISDIIKDILKMATDELGIKYRLEMREGKLYIEKYSDLIIKPKFKPASNLGSFNVLDATGDICKSESISDMRNSILISSGDEKSSKVLAEARDDINIAKFGLLQDVESVDDKDIAQAKNIANNKLKELNRVGQDISLELLGDDSVRSGRIIEVDNYMFDMKGRYLVKECTHSVQNRIHKMNITIEKVI